MLYSGRYGDLPMTISCDMDIPENTIRIQNGKFMNIASDKRSPESGMLLKLISKICFGII